MIDLKELKVGIINEINLLFEEIYRLKDAVGSGIQELKSMWGTKSGSCKLLSTLCNTY